MPSTSSDDDVFASVIIFQNQSQRVVSCDIIPCPIDEYDQLVPDAQDQHQMQEHPDHPGEISSEVDKREIDNRLVPAYGCHRTQVPVFIRFLPFLACMDGIDILRQIFPLTDCHVCDLRMSFRVFFGLHVGDVSDGKHIFQPLDLVLPVQRYPVAANNLFRRNALDHVAGDACRPDHTS